MESEQPAPKASPVPDVSKAIKTSIYLPAKPRVSFAQQQARLLYAMLSVSRGEVDELNEGHVKSVRAVLGCRGYRGTYKGIEDLGPVGLPSCSNRGLCHVCYEERRGKVLVDSARVECLRSLARQYSALVMLSVRLPKDHSTWSRYLHRKYYKSTSKHGMDVLLRSRAGRFETLTGGPAVTDNYLLGCRSKSWGLAGVEDRLPSVAKELKGAEASGLYFLMHLPSQPLSDAKKSVILSATATKILTRSDTFGFGMPLLCEGKDSRVLRYLLKCGKKLFLQVEPSLLTHLTKGK